MEKTDLPIIPALGAGTFGALVSLHVGWNLNMLFILDGDAKGKEECERYIKDYGLDKTRSLTVSDLIDGVKVIEDLLDDVALDRISKELELNKKPTKNQIRRFFQEGLAKDELCNLGKGFEKKATHLLDQLQSRFKAE